MTCQVELHRGTGGLRALADDWNALHHVCGSGFQASHWAIEAAVRHRCPDPEGVYFFALRDPQGRLVAVAPLHVVQRRIKRIPFLTWDMPEDPDRPINEFPCLDESTALEVFAHLPAALRQARPDVSLLAIDRLAHGSRTWLALTGAEDIDGWARRTSSVSRIPIVHSPAEPTERLSADFRNNLRKKWSRLTAEGPVSHQVDRAATEIAAALERFVALESAGWKGREEAGNALAKSTGRLAYSRAAVNSAAAQGSCEIHSLWCAERCISALIAFRGGGELYFYKGAYDEDYARFSPSHLLRLAVFQGCAHRADLRSCNVGAEASWYHPWRPQVTPLWSLVRPLGGPAGWLGVRLARLPTRRELSS